MIDVLDFLYIAQSFRDPRVQGSFVDPRETGYTAWFLAAYQYLYDPSYYSHVRDVFLGANSIRSRYSPQYGFTTNADPLFDSAYLTPYGYSGPNNRGSTWLAAFLMKALIAFAETSPVPADRTATLSLVQTSFDTFMSSHYMGGRCQEITYSSNYLSCSSGNMPSDPYLGLPPGSVTATNGNSIITGSGTNFTNLGIFRNDGSDYIGVNIGTGYQMLNIPAGGITSATSLRTNTPFTGTSASGLTYGRGAACPDGTGRSGFPQNTYSTLDEDLADCASPPHYGMGGRTVSELVHQINGYLYYKTGSESYKAQGDALFAAAYGCGTSAKGCLRGGTGLAEGIQGGGPGADAGSGNFGDLLVYPVDSQSARGKEFGSNAGAALADSYLAYRLGGQEQPVSRTVQIGYDAAAVPIGGQVRVSVVQPTGNVVRKVCTATPCGVVVDARMGNHLLKLDYLSPSGAVLASGQPAPLRVK